MAPIDNTAWTWLVFLGVYMTFALPYEDVRDMDCDLATGRRTFALLLGPTFVRRWFAILMFLYPSVFYHVLARTSGVTEWKQLASVAILAPVSWLCAARALLRHGRSADRLTLLLFYLVWGLILGTAPLLMART